MPANTEKAMTLSAEDQLEGELERPEHAGVSSWSRDETCHGSMLPLKCRISLLPFGLSERGQGYTSGAERGHA